MQNIQRVVKVIPKGQWADSSVYERLDILFRSPVERVQDARKFYRKLYSWLHGGRKLPTRMERIVRVFRYGK